MTEQEYLSAVQRIRAHIERGGRDDLEHAEAGLAELRGIFPKRLPFLCAEAELMLAKGEDAERCRNVIDYVIQEFDPQEGLSDLLALKSRTFSDGSPEWRQLHFLSEFYRTRILPEKPLALLNEMKHRMLAGTIDVDGLHALAAQYYVTRNTLLSAVLMMAWCRQTGAMEHYEDYVLLDAGQPYPYPFFNGNFTYLARMLTDGKAYTFLLLDDAAGDSADMEILAAALDMLGQTTVILRENDAVQEVRDAHAYALQCIQEAQTSQNHIVITAGKCRTERGAVTDAAPAVIRLLARSVTQDAPLIVFSRDVRMGELHRRESLGGDIQRLSHCLPPPFSYGLSFAWAGDYLKYISYLYGESAEDLLAAPASCDFSIVIPVRNSAGTLRYTLETCLAIDYDGSYEIVLSDNSDAGCTAVRDLYEELGDPRIRYYKTPASLSLDKNFEFGFLHARGAFVFAIGADDGVYPWVLKYLQKSLADHPDESLFGWKRSLYMWPGFLPHERSFLQVRLYDAEDAQRDTQIGLYAQRDDIIARIDDVFYELPLLYINSGFRRGYLKTLLHKTGRLLDGISQDSYMGTVNFLLNDHFIRIDVPLTLAGMSGCSIGAGTLCYHADIDAEAFAGIRRKRAHEQISEYVMRDGEYRAPYIDTADKYGFYLSLLRLQEMGVTDAAFSETVFFDYLAQNLYVSDIQLERFMGMLFYAASQYSPEMLRACRGFYEAVCAEPKKVDVPKTELFSTYQTGYSAEYQKLTLDGNAFACRTVADAVRLTAQILNL